MPKIRLLAADDDPITRLLLTHCLANNPDFELVTVESGQEVLDRLNRDERFDVLLVDWLMPVMSAMRLSARCAPTSNSITSAS